MWWSASILLRSTSTINTPLPAPYEEAIVLISAVDKADADAQAERIGQVSQTRYTSISGEDIAVSFECVLSVHEILAEELSAGVELFSRHLRATEAESLQHPHHGPE